MLFGYPVAANNDNWLHNTLIEMLTSVETLLNNEEPIPQWEDILPDAHRDQLLERDGLETRFYDFVDAISGLPEDADKARIFKAIRNQNNIETLLNGTSDCEGLAELPEVVRCPAKRLFNFAFKLLTILGIRDVQYKAIYNHITDKVCPFCGIEFFDAPSAPREDLDHYLMINKYVFAGVNLSNLVPIGDKCNQGYKKTKDMIRRDDGKRRRAFYPYDHISISLTLNNSEILATDTSHNWHIEFELNCEEIETWKDVFEIETRYKRDVLNLKFDLWLTSFRNWIRKEGLNRDFDKKVLIEKIIDYIEILTLQKLSGIDTFRLPVFHMLKHQCEANNQKVINFLIDIILL